MKKLLALFLMMTLLLTGCAAAPQSTTEPQKSTQTEIVTPPETTTAPRENTEPECTEPVDITAPSQDIITEPNAEPTDAPVREETAPLVPTEPTNPTVPEEPTEVIPTEVPGEPTKPENTKPENSTEDHKETESETPGVQNTLTLNVPVGTPILVGSTYQIDYTYTGNPSELKWVNQTPKFCTVDQNGLVTALDIGYVLILVEYNGGNKYVGLTVTYPVEETPQRLFTIHTEPHEKVQVGTTYQIEYTYLGDPSDLIWSTTTPDVCSVDQNGLVTAKSVGFGEILVEYPYEGYSQGEFAYLNIYIPNYYLPTTKLEIHSLNAPLYDGVVKYAGDTLEFQAQVGPYGTNYDTVVTSSDSSIVSVSCKNAATDSKKIVTLSFKKAGSATITVKSADGEKSLTYRITVKNDYACNPGSGLLTPEQFAECYSYVIRENGMTTYAETRCGYVECVVSPRELTWSNCKKWAQGKLHWWYSIGYENIYMVLIPTEDGNYIYRTYGY